MFIVNLVEDPAGVKSPLLYTIGIIAREMVNIELGTQVFCGMSLVPYEKRQKFYTQYLHENVDHVAVYGTVGQILFGSHHLIKPLKLKLFNEYYNAVQEYVAFERSAGRRDLLLERLFVCNSATTQLKVFPHMSDTEIANFSLPTCVNTQLQYNNSVSINVTSRLTNARVYTFTTLHTHDIYQIVPFIWFADSEIPEPEQYDSVKLSLTVCSIVLLMNAPLFKHISSCADKMLLKMPDYLKVLITTAPSNMFHNYILQLFVSLGGTIDHVSSKEVMPYDYLFNKSLIEQICDTYFGGLPQQIAENFQFVGVKKGPHQMCRACADYKVDFSIYNNNEHMICVKCFVENIEQYMYESIYFYVSKNQSLLSVRNRRSTQIVTFQINDGKIVRIDDLEKKCSVLIISSKKYEIEKCDYSTLINHIFDTSTGDITLKVKSIVMIR